MLPGLTFLLAEVWPCIQGIGGCLPGSESTAAARRSQCWPERPSTALPENCITYWLHPGISRILGACCNNRRHSEPGKVPGNFKWEIPDKGSEQRGPVDSTPMIRGRVDQNFSGPNGPIRDMTVLPVSPGGFAGRFACSGRPKRNLRRQKPIAC